jgi:exopolysaccharide biosynthesis polyprenyl glycosylphosphotransferase
MDAISLYLAFGLVHYVRLDQWVTVDASLLLVAVTVLTGLYVVNVYHFARQGHALRHAARTFLGVALSGAVVAAFVYVTKTTTATTVLWRGNLPLSLFFFAIWASFVRYSGSVLAVRYGRPPSWLVIGEKNSTDALRSAYQASRLEGSFNVIPADFDLLKKLALSCRDSVVSVTNPGNKTLFEGRVSGIILGNSRDVPEEFTAQLMHVRLIGIPVLELSDFYEQRLLRVPVMELKDRWFALSKGFTLVHREIELKIKRVLDVVVSGCGLLVLLPFLVLVGLVVKATSRGPALYSQIRCGMNNQEFWLRKFRTMVDNAEADGAQWSKPGDKRITGVGRLLRKSRIDELPQLWNVLMGEMSFIGPRPERPDFVSYLEKSIPYYELRHLVKPGITGWAQVMYPYGSSEEDARNKLEFDLYYIKNYSLALDLYILLRTIRVVFERSGR